MMSCRTDCESTGGAGRCTSLEDAMAACPPIVAYACMHVFILILRAIVDIAVHIRSSGGSRGYLKEDDGDISVFGDCAISIAIRLLIARAICSLLNTSRSSEIACHLSRPWKRESAPNLRGDSEKTIF
jgi:hypothetical protein